MNKGYAKAGSVTNYELLYSWDNTNWYSFANLPAKTNYGEYRVYYKPDASLNANFNEAESSSFTVNIIKTNIKVGALTTAGKNLTYKQ